MNSIKDLFEKALTEALSKELSGNAGDVLVIHTSVAYNPGVQLVQAKNIKKFFTEKNGYDEDDNIPDKIKGLKSGGSVDIDSMFPNAVIVIKL